ncbi:hypothetical protein GGF40_002624 [Coemansia sp. RSA 1286]|nr:hypothetical protein GGF40_002624 [Coemansia sp. RSA 1286]
MITPRFSVRQDEKQVYVTIHAPHVRAQAIEFDVDEYQFKFFASPYYLRLTFSGKVVEDEASTASFDAASGDITVALSKQTPGEQFENLDMLTSLLATSRERDTGETNIKKPIIEEIGGSISADDQIAILNDEDFEWELPQSLPVVGENELLVGKVKYGFNEQYSGLLAHVHSTANEINEVSDPEHLNSEERRIQRIATEDAKFDDAYYMDNYMNDDDEIRLSIQFKTEFYSLLRQLQKAKKRVVTEPGTNSLISQDVDTTEEVPLSEIIEFTDSEKKMMVDLPRKTHMISNRQAIYLGLVDILFSYSLDLRINQGEPTVESAWAIGAVSATFSNLEQFSTLDAVVAACFRRGLAYPLYRNWELCEKALEDIYVILKLGRRAVLKALLEIKSIFDKHDIYYIYSKLFIDDYCVWIQTLASDKAIRSLAHKLHNFEIEKDDLGWNLDALEDLALESSVEDEECEEAGHNENTNIDEPDSLALDESNALADLSIVIQEGSPKADSSTCAGSSIGKRMVKIIGGDGASEIDQDSILPEKRDNSQELLDDTDTLDEYPGSSILENIVQSDQEPEAFKKEAQKKKGPLIEML